MSVIAHAAARRRQIRTMKSQSVNGKVALTEGIESDPAQFYWDKLPVRLTLRTRGIRGQSPFDLSHLPAMIFMILACLITAEAQNNQANGVRSQDLPDSPGFNSAAMQSVSQAVNGTATISGTVEDPNGSVIQGAQVRLETLESADGSRSFTSVSGGNGEFTFRGLSTGIYKLSVTGKGWGKFESSNISLAAAESKIIPGVVLPIETAVTEVRVGGSREEMATEQIHIAEQQRVLGVLPNFYTAFDWNAPPLDTKRKYQLAFRSLVDPATFAGIAFISGIEQANDTYHDYGQGVQGYAKRYGAAYATDFTSRMLDSAVFPSIFHQDPRYFYKGSGTKKSRVIYAISSAIFVRNDEGARVPNYSRILGSFAAGAISNLYYPKGSRGVGLTISNGFLEIGGNAANNLVREFLLKRFTTHVTNGAGGQPD